MKVVGDCHWEVFTNEVNKKSFSLSYDYNVVLNDQAANCVVAALGMNSPRKLFKEILFLLIIQKRKPGGQIVKIYCCRIVNGNGE